MNNLLRIAVQFFCSVIVIAQFRSFLYSRALKQAESCQINEIGGGQAADPSRYPYLISLQDQRVNSEGQLEFKHFCGGTLIAPNLVLTAAHCIWYTYNDIDVRLDKDQQGRIIDNAVWAALNPYCRHSEGYGRLPVTKFYLPSQYDGLLDEGYDIAILQLSGNFQDYQGPYCDYLASTNVNMDSNRDEVVVVGWGVTDISEFRKQTHASVQSIAMQQTWLQYLNPDDCNAALQIDVSSSICLQSEQSGVCVGDSGGPALLQGGGGPSGDIQLGIVSWSLDEYCMTFGLPTVFTKIAAFVDWIDSTVRQHQDNSVVDVSPFDPQDTTPKNRSPSPIEAEEPQLTQLLLFTPTEPSRTVDSNCNVVYKTQYGGDLISESGAEDETQCCSLCQSDSLCNVWVYCPRPLCEVSYSMCSLYYDDQITQGQSPKILSSGDTTFYTSGMIKSKIYPTGECEINYGANYAGILVTTQELYVGSQVQCCNLCQANPRCNTFVYCPRDRDCRNPGSIDHPTIPFQSCYLKYQEPVLQGSEPVVYNWNTDFISGIIRNKQILDQGSGSCEVRQKTNADGLFLYGLSTIVDSTSSCCISCTQNPYCNTWVFCPNLAGCGPPNQRQKYGSCDLKFQGSVAKNEEMTFYDSGPSVRFSSGFLTQKQFNGKCVIRSNINLKGAYIIGLQAENEGECCDKCKFYNGCNVFNYCANSNGCRNLDEIIPPKSCDLKFQVEVQNYDDPQAWYSGEEVDFISGIIPGKSWGSECIKLEKNNLKGIVLTSYKVGSAQECCGGCKGLQQCNVWVYCEKQQGCLSQDHFVETQTCTLKFLDRVANGLTPTAWEEGSDTNFTSGFIFGKAQVQQ